MYVCDIKMMQISSCVENFGCDDCCYCQVCLQTEPRVYNRVAHVRQFFKMQLQRFVCEVKNSLIT